MTSIRHFKKKWSWFITATLLSGLKIMVGHMPPPVLSILARGIGNSLYVILWKKRSQAVQNLQRVLSLPDGGKGARRLARDNFCHLYTSFQELFEICYLTPAEIKKRIAVLGLENLDSALAHDRGVICVSAHLGNFPLIALRLSISGYPFNVLVRGEKNDKVEAFFWEWREKFAIRTLYRGQSYHPLVRALKRKEILWLFLDQFPRKSEIQSEFLGSFFPVYAGSVRLARATGAPVVPITTTRLSSKKHIIRIFPQAKLEGDFGKQIGSLLEILEKEIKLTPAQWFWWHKDWLQKRAKIKTSVT